ncbi:homeobox protein 4-like [Abeliophyllum distichum]|uniref:Homeobox protein 4-like n=1 Tax=Abeliophyllum distichum TaxID=126358 RepID=A0ABD1RPT6_9LAMI
MCSLLDLLDANPNNGINPLDMNPNDQVMQNGTENSISYGFSPQPMNSCLLANVGPMNSLLHLQDVNPIDEVMQNGNEHSMSHGFSPQPMNSIARDSNNGVVNPNNQVMQNGTENSISCCFSPQLMNLSPDVESMCSSLLDLLDGNPNNELNPLDVSPNNQVMQNGTENSISYGFSPQPMNWIGQDFDNELNPLDLNPNNQVMQNGTGNSLSYGFCPTTYEFDSLDVLAKTL